MAQALNEAKLREWMHKHGPRLITLSAGICRDRHRAEEIVQEAFIKLWRQPPDVGEIAYASWLRKVVTNLSINALKRTKRPAALPEFSDDPAVVSRIRPDVQCDLDDNVSRVHRAMGRLDEPKRAILMLRVFEQLSYEEIAKQLGVPVGTVMSRLNRARLALMDEMNKELKHAEDDPLVFDIRRYKEA
jgi:RNA polymerase sigma-70 factor (ECF subfamily)